MATKSIKRYKIFKVGREKRKKIVNKIPNKNNSLKKKYLSKNNRIPENMKMKSRIKSRGEKCSRKSTQTVNSKIK